jgi:membrane-associated PAP2 superfamily phosphatase
MTENTQNNQETTIAAAADQIAVRDFKNSLFIVSIVANLVILTAWIALQVTTQFDSQLANFIFNR